MRDIKAEAAWARFDEDALTGRPVEEAKKWCQDRAFSVLVEQEGSASVLSRIVNRVRLTVRDGIVIRAHLG